MIENVIRIVREASQIMLHRNFDIAYKDGFSNSVTSADQSVEVYLKRELSKLVDGCGFICEESGYEDYDKEYVWVIDPIDGTKNFIRDLGYSGISVGLLKDGLPILGVVYNPYRDEMAYAEKGKGAFLNGKPIHVSDKSIEQALFCTAMSLYDKKLAPICFDIIREVYGDCDDIRRMGSAALELTSLACGRTDIYFEIRVFPWDFAAAQMIILEAGGFVGTVDYDQPIYTRPIPLICANTKENFDYLKAKVLRVMPQIPYES